MLTVHTTTRVAKRSYDYQDPRNRISPYYYTPLRLKESGGSGKDVTANVELRWPRYLSPPRTVYLDGIIHDEPFKNVRAVIDGDDYPLKDDRLHHCTHDHIDGELCMMPAQYGGPKQELYPCEVVSTWPSVAEVGTVTCLDSDTPRIMLDHGSWSSPTGTMYPGVWTPWAAWHQAYDADKKKVVTDVVFYDAIYLYCGTGKEFGWTKWVDVHFYLRCSIVWSSTLKRFVNAYRYTGAYKNGSSLYSVSYNPEPVGDAETFHHFVSLGKKPAMPAQALFSEGYVTSYSNVIDGGPDGLNAFDPPLHLISRLRDRYITHDFEDQAGLAIADCSQQALLNTKALDINTLMYLKDYAEVGKLISSYTDLYTKGINPKTVSGAFLASYYGVRLTVKDTKKIIKCARRLSKHIKKEYNYSYGRRTTTLDNGVRLKANVSIAYSQYDRKWLRFLDDLSSFDLLPTPSRIWDMISYSFVMDWFLPISDVLEAYDALSRWILVKMYRSCSSVEATVELDVDTLYSSASGFTGYGHADFVHYYRHYSAIPPIPFPWLGIDGIDSSWNMSRFLVSAALIAQRIE